MAASRKQEIDVQQTIYHSRELRMALSDHLHNRKEYFTLYIDGLMQKRCNSSALAMELRLFCIKLSF